MPDTGDPALLDARTTAVTTFIAGDHTIDGAGGIARLLQAVATAVSALHAELPSAQ